MKKKAPAPKPLNPKQLRFVDLYLVSLNATKAYQEAYGCTEKAASASGIRLLGDARVAALVASRAEERAKRVQVDADTVLRELSRMATVDIAEAYDDNNCLLPIRKIPEDTRRAIAGIEVDEIYEWVGEGKDRKRELVGYTKKVKFWDKPGTNNLLGKHLKLFLDRIELEAGESLAKLIADAARTGKSAA